MPYTLQFKRYSTLALSSITGANGELIVDTTKDTITVHDGATAGGFALATEIFATSSASYQITQNSSVTWTNSSPAPGSPWRTQLVATSGAATLSFYTGLPGFGSSKTWTIDEDKITFTDGTIQTTAWTSNLLTSYTLNASLTSTLASYTTNANLTSTLNSYATKTFVTSALTSYTTNANLTSTLASYTTNANLTSTLASYTTNANLTSTQASYQLITSTLTLTNLTSNSITATGNASIVGASFHGTSTFTKAGYSTGDILLDNAATDTPGVIYYYGNNTNFGTDVYNSTWRVVKNLNEAGGAELLSINTSGNLTIAGSLIQANRPAFRIIGNGGQISSTTTVNNNYWVLDYQQGTALNTSTGIFTAPLTGLYQIDVVVRTFSNTNSSINQVLVYKVVGTSSTVQLMVEFGVNTSMNHAGASTISKLNAGEQLKFVVSAGTISFDSNDNWSVAYIG